MQKQEQEPAKQQVDKQANIAKKRPLKTGQARKLVGGLVASARDANLFS